MIHRKLALPAPIVAPFATQLPASSGGWLPFVTRTCTEAAALALLAGNGPRLLTFVRCTCKCSVDGATLLLQHPHPLPRSPRVILLLQTFAAHYTDAGWLVARAAEGFLTRKRAEGSPTMCVHGGTTATVMVIYGGRRAVVANVGDSSALLCGGHATEHVMRTISTWPGSATAPAAAAPASAVVARPDSNPDFASGPSQMEMSADHSPESDAEFFRMRDTRPSMTDKSRPELLFVYDTLTSSKMSCPQIFHVDPASGRARRTNRGSYYKNVRNEWATLVATPSFAQFQDALAFTRSLGDLHLQSYGVSHLPEVRWIDLAPAGPDGVPAPATDGPICIAACSDGIWDNWKFHDVASFVLHRERMAHPDAQARTVALMSNNLERAHINFGSSADNMTAVCIYLTPRKPAAHGSSSSSSSAGAAAAASTASSGH